MRLIKPSVEIIPQAPGLEGIYQQIEKAGRVCYKSESKITEDSAKEFADRMIKSGHGAMLEHGTVYLCIPPEAPITGYKYRDNKYSEYREIREGEKSAPRVHKYISTNMRVIVENNWLDDLKYLCEPTEHHEKRATVKFILSRSIAQEFTRHRVFSYAMESQRYCNYSKDKFNNEITYIQPNWFDVSKMPKHSVISSDEFGTLITERYLELTGKEESYFKPWDIAPEASFITGLQIGEALYFSMLKQKKKPQEAREVLPNACKTELVMTGFVSDWKHFFELRCDKRAHPDARVLADQLKEQFREKGWIIQ